MEVWEHHLEQTIEAAGLPGRESLIIVRRGQGLFKKPVARVERLTQDISEMKIDKSSGRSTSRVSRDIAHLPP
jgi:hypothetical protein